MAKYITSLLSLFLILNITLKAQNCPSYNTNVSSTTDACADQTYFLEIENTVCPGTIDFLVIGNYGDFGYEIEWEITSNLTNNVIASGIGSNNTAINISITGINPTVEGQIFTLNVYDVSFWQDGFSANGFIDVEQNGSTLATVSGNFGASVSTIFGPSINASSATLNVLLPSGNVSSIIVSGCRDFSMPLVLLNTNFCNTVNVDLPWEILCDITGALLANGTHTVLVQPKVPSDASDIVDITWNAASCSWDVSPLNDCNNLDIGTIFTISPDPNLPAANACGNIDQDFNVDYLGLAGGPNCCSTGGPLTPINYDLSVVDSSVSIASSPFGGTNNSAYIQIPANTTGGNATSLSFDVAMTGYSFPDPPSTTTDNSFWVTIYVDGNPVSDIQYFTNSFNITIDLSSIPGGYDENSVVEIYIYPNSFSAGIPTINTTFVPGATNLNEGEWTASTFTVNFSATFEEFTTSPVNCTFVLTSTTACCAPTTVPNANDEVCSGNLGNYNTWKTAVETANTSCLVYSSVTPLAGTTLVDSIFPSGINTTCAPVDQVLGAYAYCDVNGNGSVDNGDTYTLISSYTLTVNPAPPVLTIDNGACGVAPTAIIACNGTSVLTETGIAPTANPCGNGVNTTNINGSFTSIQIASALNNADATCYTAINYDVTASCNQGTNSTSNLDTTICNGATFVLNGTTYGNGNLTGTETIIGGTANGCDSIITVNVTELASDEPNLILDATPDTVLVGSSSILNAVGNGDIEWDNLISGSTQTVTPTTTTTYAATLTDNLGCTNTQTITVYVLFETTEMKVPDAFSPNGDGLNDVFKVVNASDFNSIELKIYNRWGDLLHKGTNEAHGWDGNYKLKAQDIDSYIYYINAKTLNDEDFNISGTVNLIK